MLKLNSFNIDGAFSYGKGQVIFTPGLILLEGQNLDEGNSISNMAGKSSIFEGITTVLFEKNSKEQIKDDLINVILNNTATLILDFDFGNNKIKIEYNRTNGKGNWRIWENGKETTKSITEMKRYIPSIIGMDYGMFVSASYMAQGRISKFMEADSSERLALLYKFFGLDKAELLREKVKEVKKEVSENVTKLDIRIKQWEELTFDESLEKKIADLEHKINTFNGVPVSKIEYETLEKDFNKKLHLVKQHPNIKEDIDNLKNKINDFDGKIKWAEDVLKKLMDDKCYVCGSPLDGTLFKAKIQEEYNQNKRNRSLFGNELTVLQDIWFEIKGWDTEKDRIKLENTKNKVGDRDVYKRYVEELGSLKKQKEIKEKLGNVDTLKKEKEELQKTLEVLDFWYEGFSNRGIPLMVLERLLDGLNRCIKLYGDRLERNVKCIIDNEKLIIDVTDKWKNVKINYLSGSEQMIVSLILSFGLWEYLNQRGRGTNVLFLDEVLAPFDSTMRIRVAELLKDVAKDRCVVVITHNEDVKELLDWSQIWLVEKQNGISNLKML